MKYSKRCRYVWYRRGVSDCKYPCSLLVNHEGAHIDGYGHNRIDGNWNIVIDYEEVFNELRERCEAAGRADLLEGL